MAAATTIPETVTVPGQVVYDAIVALEAVENLLMRLSGSAPSGDLGEELTTRAMALYRAAFGEWFMDEDLNPGSSGEQVEGDAQQLLHGSLARLNESVAFE
jgi:hypothetical protein